MSLIKSLKEPEIQDYITLGYLYLVALGAINIVIYYGSLNINIFDYIAISDILLAPINMLFLFYIDTAVNIITIGLISYLLKFLMPSINKFIEKIAHNFNWVIKGITYKPIIMFMILFSYKFLDSSVKMANRVSARVQNKTYKLDSKLTFTDNTQKDVCVVATTSLYIFYVENGEDVVTVMPISGNIKSVKEIKMQ